MPAVTIYHDDGSTETIPTTVDWSQKQIIGEMYRLTIEVERSLAQSVSLTKKEDEVELDGYKRGVLANIDTGGPTWVLTVYSPEWYATLTEPTDGGVRVTGSDSSLITDRIDTVNEWSTGEIATLSPSLTFVLNHAFSHEAIRKYEKNLTGEIQFEGDGTVNYVRQLGSEYYDFSETGGTGSTLDVSDDVAVVVELHGAGGGDLDSNGGVGGYIKARIDVSNIDSLSLYAGEQGDSNGDGGLGLYDGGNGQVVTQGGVTAEGAGGGGSTSIVGDGDELLHADAGGGGQDQASFDDNGSTVNFAADGGGGARGGVPNAEGTGFGGDGGGVGGFDGEDGGQEAVDSRVTVLDSSTGGGNSGNGTISVDVVAEELTPDNSNLENRIRVVERGLTLDATHVRVIGAHEGEAQYFANLVPSDDGDTYANRINYETDRWSPGDEQDWDRWENKDVMSQETIDEEARSLGDEINKEYVEVKTTVRGDELDLGEFVRVVKSDANIDRDMRVHQLVTKTAPDSPAGVVQEVTLSTRTIARSELNSNQRDIQRFNTAFQGSSVIVEGGGGRQPVDANINAVESFRYPPVEYEHEALVEVTGLPYRAYSSGAAGGAVNATGALVLTGFTINSGTNETISDNIPNNYSEGPITLKFEARITLPNSSDPVGGQELDIKWTDDDGDYYESYRITIPAKDSFEDRFRFTSGDISPIGLTASDQITLEIDNVSTYDIEFEAVSFRVVGEEPHTHGADPGVIESFPDDPASNVDGLFLPSGVDVLVNGNTVATDVGSGEFNTVVDISDELVNDSFNTIEATSDSLGHIRLTPYVEAYKQIGGE